MKRIPFVKYQGTGNDFILIDARNEIPEIDVAHWCHRKFGIGADGLMFLVQSEVADFEMIYYNADGKLSSMCGNGGRCIAHWASQLGIHKKSLKFLAPDGFHEATIDGNQVKLSMNDVSVLNKISLNIHTLNTGSPHYVKQLEHFPVDFVKEARTIRNSPDYIKDGINVNFFQINGLNQLKCRTYERGVEDETLSCGTGVTAVALTYANYQNLNQGIIQVETEGGQLKVHFKKNKSGVYTHIFLEGPADFVFAGNMEI